MYVCMYICKGPRVWSTLNQSLYQIQYQIAFCIFRFRQSRERNPTIDLCVCVVIPFILDVKLVDAPAGFTQEEDHTGFFHLPSAVLALIFIVRRIQPFFSLVDRGVEFCVPTNQSFSTCYA